MLTHKPDLYLGSKCRSDRTLFRAALERFKSSGHVILELEPLVAGVVNYCLETGIPFEMRYGSDKTFTIRRIAH